MTASSIYGPRRPWRRNAIMAAVAVAQSPDPKPLNNIAAAQITVKH
jgi:hypothetical protein